jgi:hypothetical protein
VCSSARTRAKSAAKRGWSCTPLAQARIDAGADQLHREWLEDVVGRRELGGADDLVAVGLGREHDEDRRWRDQAVVAQVFEQLLAILAFAGAAGQVVFAQEDVVGALLQLADGRVGIDRVLDPGDAHRRQHILQAGAHAGIGIDHQHCQVRVLLHVRSRLSLGCRHCRACRTAAHRKIVYR